MYKNIKIVCYKYINDKFMLQFFIKCEYVSMNNEYKVDTRCNYISIKKFCQQIDKRYTLFMLQLLENAITHIVDKKQNYDIGSYNLTKLYF